MKIRISYVSNSSSSSFIIIGTKINNPLKSILNKKKVIVQIECGGTSGENEDWIMELDLETFRILKESEWFNRNKDYTQYFEVDENAYTDNEKVLHIVNDINNKEIYYFNRDYSSPDSKEKLIEFLKRR